MVVSTSQTQGIQEAYQCNEYTLLELIGRGYTSEVFLANDPSGATVAVKNLVRFECIDLFCDEARISIRASHRHVVSVYAHGVCEGESFIAMELVDGVSVETLYREKVGYRPLPLLVVADIIAQAARGLAHIHTLCGEDGSPLRAVHLDVKPGNMLVTRGGVVKICDFGSAHFVGMTPRPPGRIHGTPSFMSPGLVAGRDPSPQDDIFALGTVMFGLAMGKLAFYSRLPTTTMRAISRRVGFNELIAELDHVSSALADVLKRCWGVGQEYRDADALAEDLENVGPPLKGPSGTPEQCSLAKLVEECCDEGQL